MCQCTRGHFMHCKRRFRCLCNCFTPTELYGYFVQVWTFPLLLLQLLVCVGIYLYEYVCVFVNVWMYISPCFVYIFVWVDLCICTVSIYMFVCVWACMCICVHMYVFSTYAVFVLYFFFVCVCVYLCNFPVFRATFPYILTMMMTTNSCAKTSPLCSKLHSYSPTTHDIFWQLFLLTAYHKTSLSARRLLFIITYIAPWLYTPPGSPSLQNYKAIFSLNNEDWYTVFQTISSERFM